MGTIHEVCGRLTLDALIVFPVIFGMLWKSVRAPLTDKIFVVCVKSKQSDRVGFTVLSILESVIGSVNATLEKYQFSQEDLKLALCAIVAMLEGSSVELISGASIFNGMVKLASSKAKSWSGSENKLNLHCGGQTGTTSCRSVRVCINSTTIVSLVSLFVPGWSEVHHNDCGFFAFSILRSQAVFACDCWMTEPIVSAWRSFDESDV